MKASIASKSTWKAVAGRLVFGWIVIVAGVTVYEWNSLPRPSGYFVDAVDPSTGNFHAHGKTKLTWSDLESEIARVRRVFEPHSPTAAERLFTRDDKSGFILPPDDTQRWDEILNGIVPNSSITDSSYRDALLMEVTGLPEASVSKNPEAAMRLARLLELKKGMSKDPIYAAQILDPEFNALSQPAAPRLRWIALLAATITPIVLVFLLVALLPLKRRKVQSPARETAFKALDSGPPVAENAEVASIGPSMDSISWIDRSYRELKIERNYWTYALGAALFVLLMGQLGRYLGSHTTQGTSAPIQSGSPETSAEIRVMTSAQDSEGITELQWDQKFLSNLESYSRERITHLAKQYLARNGQPNATVVLESQAVYVESDNHKLAVIRIRGSDGSNQALIHGIVGDQLKRVLCVRKSTEQIPITYGPCGEKLKEVFGLSLSTPK